MLGLKERGVALTTEMRVTVYELESKTEFPATPCA